MRGRLGRFMVAGVVTVLALPATIAVTESVAGAITSGCVSTMGPVAEGAASDMTVSCVTDAADQGTNPEVTDYSNARWHSGAIREFTLCTWALGGTAVSCGAAQGAPGSAADVNHTATGHVTTAGIRTFITANTGGNNWTLSRPATKAAFGTGKFWIENSTARAVGNAAGTAPVEIANGLTTVNGSTTVLANLAAVANFNAGDVGKSISSECIPSGATIASVVSTIQVTMSNAATCTQSVLPGTVAGDEYTTAARVLSDVAINAGSTTITSVSAIFQASDIGLYVKGVGIPALAYITAVGGFGTTAVISAAATASTKDPIATTVTGTANGLVYVGKPTLTAPKDGDKVGALLTQITLNPGLVPGSRACASGESTGFGVPATWQNPGKFSKILFLGVVSIPDITGAIAQIVYKTSVTTFAAYVIPTSATGDFVVKFPFVPTSIAVCPGTNVAAGFRFHSSSTSQSTVPTGVGRPGSAAVRGILGLNAAGTPETTTPELNNDTNVNKVYTLATNGLPTSTFTLTYNGCTTTALKGSDTAKNIDKALRLLTGACGGVGVYPLSLNVNVTGTAPSFTITFVRALAASNTPTLTGAGAAFTSLVVPTAGSSTPHSFPGTACTLSRPNTFGWVCGNG